MTSSVASLKHAINEVRYNPAAIQRMVFETLEQTSNGEIDVVDPTNPFVFLLEASSVLTSAQMEEAENLTRRLYPSMAITEEELYLHMSDRDYVGRFGSPSRTTFKLLFNKDELVKRAVSVPDSEVRKIVIPRDTELMVADYTFTLEYPIELRVMGHGGIQVVYDVSRPSPIQALETNIVDWRMVRMRDEEYVQLTIPVNQFKITTQYAHINKSTNYSKTYDIDDNFYYCRVYRAMPGGVWDEIRTTHTDQVFDPNNPTVLLKVFEQGLNVTIPQVYVSNRTLDRELRIDIYTTKGPLDLILDSYIINDFTANWRDIGKESVTYSAPLNIFTSMAVYSDDIVTGGSNQLSFADLRERVMTNALGNAQLPITGEQLKVQLANMGYQSIRDVDNVTNRIYLATRRLPQPKSRNTQGGAASTVASIQGTYDEIVDYDGVIDNGDRLTITTDALFIRENGVTLFYPNSKKNALPLMGINARLNEINERRLVASPFHYVLDATGSYFDARAYYLDGPKIENRQYIEENSAFNFYLETERLSVYKRHNGYAIQIIVKTGKALASEPDDTLIPQISYRPAKEQRDVFLNGRLIKRYQDQWVFEFLLESTFDVTSEHHLMFNNLTMYPDEIKPYRADLSGEFNIVHYLPNRLISGENKGLRYRGAKFLVGDDYSGASHETVKVKFGDRLEGFWENSRTVLGSSAYVVHENDIPAVYEENVYKRDPVTGAIDISLDDDGNIVYELLHRKGDPVYDSEGNVTYKAFAGEPVLDENGNPVIERDRNLLREWDMFFFDARYRFATRNSDVNYLNELPQTILSWLKTDIALFRGWALEQTDIFLYPQRTIGTAEAIVGENEVRRVDLEQRFTVTYYLTYDKYADTFVRETLTELVEETLAEALTHRQVRRNEIIAKITAQAGEDIVAVNVEGLGGDDNLDTLTLKQDTERCAIRKRIQQSLDGELEVVDDVTVNFVRHTELES